MKHPDHRSCEHPHKALCGVETKSKNRRVSKCPDCEEIIRKRIEKSAAVREARAQYMREQSSAPYFKRGKS